MLCFGLGIYLMPFARQGYPEVMALPFLIVAVNRWAKIGTAGRLGALGVTSAVCLGVAASTQQIAWFIVPFMVIGLLLCRLGDQPHAVAWWLVTRYVLIVGAVLAVINAPFVIWNAKAWSTALVTPTSVETVPHGQGLIDVAYYLLGGSGNLQFFSYGSLALAAGLVVCFALLIRRLGPAMAVMPWPIFFVSIRSSDKYFYIMMPLWLLCLATVRHRDFANAYEPDLRLGAWRPLRRPLSRIAVGAAVLAPAVVLVVIAIATPQPLRMAVQNVTATKSAYTKEIDVEVTNTSSRTITPHFALSNSQSMSRFWVPSSGPTALTPGQSALYVLVPSTPGARRSLLGPRILLRAVSQNPETLSSVPLPMRTNPDANVG
jgi:hypothetical protein